MAGDGGAGGGPRRPGVRPAMTQTGGRPQEEAPPRGGHPWRRLPLQRALQQRGRAAGSRKNPPILPSTGGGCGRQAGEVQLGLWCGTSLRLPQGPRPGRGASRAAGMSRETSGCTWATAAHRHDPGTSPGKRERGREEGRTNCKPRGLRSSPAPAPQPPAPSLIPHPPSRPSHAKRPTASCAVPRTHFPSLAGIAPAPDPGWRVLSWVAKAGQANGASPRQHGGRFK